MRKGTRAASAIGGLVATLVVGGCAGQATNELAVESGDAALTIGIQLDRFARRQKAIADQRTAAIGELAAVVRLGRGQLARDLDLIRRYESADAMAKLNALIALSDQYIAEDAAAKKEAIAALTAAGEGQQRVATDAQAWQKLGRGLLTLSQDNSRSSDRAKFIFGFIQDVAANVQKAQQDGQDGGRSAVAAAKTAAVEANADSGSEQ